MKTDEPGVPDEGLTTKEKIELAISLGFLVAYVLFLLKAEEGGGDGLGWRLRWWRDQVRRRDEEEALFRRQVNHVLFEAYQVVSGDAGAE